MSGPQLAWSKPAISASGSPAASPIAPGTAHVYRYTSQAPDHVLSLAANELVRNVLAASIIVALANLAGSWLNLPLLPVGAEILAVVGLIWVTYRMMLDGMAMADTHSRASAGYYCMACGLSRFDPAHVEPAMASIDDLARTDPATWLRARLESYVPEPASAGAQEYIKLAEAANLFLNQLRADPAGRELMLPETADPLDLHRLPMSGQFRMVEDLGLRLVEGENRPRLRWLMPDEVDPYLITLGASVTGAARP